MRDRDVDEARMGASPQTAARYRIPVPSLAPHEQVGLGSAVKRLTESAGVEPCAPCAARATALNRLIALSGQRLSVHSLLNRLLPLVNVIPAFTLVRAIVQRWRW